MDTDTDARDRLGRIVFETGQTGYNLPFGWDGVPGAKEQPYWHDDIREKCRVIGEAVALNGSYPQKVSE